MPFRPSTHAAAAAAADKAFDLAAREHGEEAVRRLACEVVEFLRGRGVEPALGIAALYVAVAGQVAPVEVVMPPPRHAGVGFVPFPEKKVVWQD